MDISYGFCSSCGSGIFGAFYFNDTQDNKIRFDIHVNEGNTTYITMDYIGNYVFELTCYARVGRNSYTIDFQTYFNEIFTGDLYAYPPIEINNLTTEMYENYYNNDCFLNEDEITKEEYDLYLLDHYSFGVFYAIGDKVKLVMISIRSYGMPDNNDLTMILGLFIATGTGLSGYGMFKYKKSRRGED